MGNVLIVQKVFLTRSTVKHRPTRSSADTDKSVRRVYVGVGDGPDMPIRSRIPGRSGPISDIYND